ncbi:ferritin 1 heavy chain [Arctopsyche grandis]|uniref:ferritin 1 heavy chain n=1 Tax=Arctopsyche grandis TaxID=121162 RepID=UPI00406D7B23
MAATITSLLVLLAVAALADAKLQCQSKPADIPTDWITMQKTCTNAMREQIQMEIKASMEYLSMGAYFSRDTVNRPGFAKMFFEASSEERQHGMKLIEYLLMRGELTSEISSLIRVPIPKRLEWENGVTALKAALNLEAEVTKSIRNLIKICEDSEEFNDYHLVDYLAGDFLDEQYKGQRDLAGKSSTLDKMMANNALLGEFLFDKKLLKGELI